MSKDKDRYVWLIRHAKSDWEGNHPDKKRPLLQARVAQDSRTMLKWIKSLSLDYPTPELYYSSPAVRAYDTARLLAKKKEISTVSKLYGKGHGAYISLIESKLHKHHSFAVVGHDPMVTILASSFSEPEYWQEFTNHDNVPPFGVLIMRISGEKMRKKTVKPVAFGCPSRFRCKGKKHK